MCYLFPCASNGSLLVFLINEPEALKEIGGIVGINKSISHHMARKTFASTVLLYNDVPMEIVSKLLGHSKLQTTQDHYGQVIEQRISEEMGRIEKGG